MMTPSARKQAFFTNRLLCERLKELGAIVASPVSAAEAEVIVPEFLKEAGKFVEDLGAWVENIGSNLS